MRWKMNANLCSYFHVSFGAVIAKLYLLPTENQITVLRLRGYRMVVRLEHVY